MDKPSLLQPRPNRSAGFSLVEVALAIGIIAFAFVALFSLVPTGLTTFRESIDISNENWIMQNMNSMVQTTDFASIPSLDFLTSDEIYYYDEEGKPTDTKQKPGTAVVQRDRLYAVKLLVQDLDRPSGASVSSDIMKHGYRILTILAPMQNPAAMTDFGKVTNSTTLQAIPETSVVHTRVFYVARMDSAHNAH